MENLNLTLIKIITHCSDVKTFRLRLDKEVERKPGQYLILTLNIKGTDVPKALSISSSPTEKGYIEFTKKLTGSDFSQTLNRLEIGTSCPIRLPMGKFTFTGEYPRVAFLSGGIGITPIRSISKYATDKKLSSSLIVLYSSRTPDYLIFKDDFSSMQRKNKNLKIVYTLTNCGDDIPGCRKGQINEDMIRQEIPDYRQRKFYMCGPPGMVDAMRKLLIDKLQTGQENIITEDFLGY